MNIFRNSSMNSCKKPSGILSVISKATPSENSRKFQKCLRRFLLKIYNFLEINLKTPRKVLIPWVPFKIAPSFP